MSRMLLAIALLGSQYSFAFDINAAKLLVKKHAETIACDINPKSFKAVQLAGQPGIDEMGDEYAVYWEGDVGCYGGSGTLRWMLTIVRKNGFGQPLVDVEIKQPSTELVCADTISVHDGIITLTGIKYGPYDKQSSPSQPVEVTLKTDYSKIKVLKTRNKPASKLLGHCGRLAD